MGIQISSIQIQIIPNINLLVAWVAARKRAAKRDLRFLSLMVTRSSGAQGQGVPLFFRMDCCRYPGEDLSETRIFGCKHNGYHGFLNDSIEDIMHSLVHSRQYLRETLRFKPANDRCVWIDGPLLTVCVNHWTYRRISAGVFTKRPWISWNLERKYDVLQSNGKC